MPQQSQPQPDAAQLSTAALPYLSCRYACPVSPTADRYLDTASRLTTRKGLEKRHLPLRPWMSYSHTSGVRGAGAGCAMLRGFRRLVPATGVWAPTTARPGSAALLITTHSSNLKAWAQPDAGRSASAPSSGANVGGAHVCAGAGVPEHT